MSASSRDPHITTVIEAVERLRQRRRGQYAARPHPGGKRFSQEELIESAHPSYKNLINGRTGRLPDRATLLQIADYLECTPAERSTLLDAAQYALEPTRAEPQRRQITILYARLTPLHALADMLDVEDLYHLTASFWNRLHAITLEFGGQVEKRSDDTLMAV